MTSLSLHSPVLRSSVRRYLRPQQQQRHWRLFHATRRRDVIKPFLLADIGEGIRECQIIQWFVQPGARVEQFDKLCEVQSDKAAVEITSPFDGVIKELHYEPDDMAIVGKPLLDIDIQSEISEADEAKLADTPTAEGTSSKSQSAEQEPRKPQGRREAGPRSDSTAAEREEINGPLGRKDTAAETTNADQAITQSASKFQTLATPAVRHLIKELSISITDIKGSGKDGRVLKEDVHRHHKSTQSQSQATPSTITSSTTTSTTSSTQSRNPVPLTPLQTAMYKTMTRSLQIPHFLYTTTPNLTPLSTLRKRLNSRRPSSEKLSPLPFIIKAVAKTLAQYPLLNASLEIPSPCSSSTSSSSSSDSAKPILYHNTQINIGIAVSTPHGLTVPVLHNVTTLSISEISSRIKDLSSRARANKLSPQELQGATFTVSNIGSLGAGGVVAPVIVPPQVGILGVGRGRVVPAFAEEGEAGGMVIRGGRNGEGEEIRIVKREEAWFSWAADHRVVDGAECARAAECVRELLEGVDAWVVDMR